MRPILPIVLLSFMASACVPQVVVRDYDSSCRVAAQMLHEPLTGADLVEISAPFPRIYADAVRAYQSGIAGIVLSSFGAAGLVGAFVTGFAANPTETPVRIGLGVDVGVTLGLGVAAIIAAKLGANAHRRAIEELEQVTRNACP
jgi:hypothetical protein